MDFSFSGLNSILSSNPALAQLANNAVSNLTSSPKPAPKVQQIAPAVTQVSVAKPAMGMGMILAIGAAVVGAVVLMVVVLKRK